jgi:hypothetical protein
MVSGIVPGAGAATALNIEPRAPRAEAGLGKSSDDRAARGDSVEVGSAAQWAGVRESVKAGLAHIEAAVKAGQQALGLVGKIREAASAEPPDQSAVDALIAQLDETVETAVASGARLLAGQNLQVQAEPNATPIEVVGLDARLKDAPGARDVITIARSAEAGEELADAAGASMVSLQAGLARLAGAGRTLSAHQSFLGAAAGALDGVRHDLDADGARLLALQVRQGLDAAGGGAIANVEPQAVLTLFRA